jgi:hypothetical protein
MPTYLNLAKRGIKDHERERQKSFTVFEALSSSKQLIIQFQSQRKHNMSPLKRSIG